jgi:SPX domain protein involved in polyphosphate accumulation
MNHVLSSKEISDSIQQTLNNGVKKVNKTKESIKMKFSNIASLCDDYNIPVLSKISRLANYSRQNETAFKSVIKKLKLSYPSFKCFVDVDGNILKNK